MRQIVGFNLVGYRQLLQARHQSPMAANHPTHHAQMAEVVEPAFAAVALACGIHQGEIARAAMAITAADVIPLSQARATLSELADQVRAGAEKIITKNGESYVALIDAQRLDYYHQLERERIHLLLISEASKGLDDVAAGRVKDARASLQAIKRRRAKTGA